MKLIIAEKPSVGRDIARVLGAKSKSEGAISGNGFTITWAIGHLVELEEPEAYNPNLKRWSLESLPCIPEQFKLRVKKAKGIPTQFNRIKKLLTQATEVICATDAGREGELIFRYIIEKANMASKPMKRLWISSLTDSAIRTGFAQLQPLKAYDNLAEAARCRSAADWIIGLNATRAYTVKHSHGSGVLSVGRVQTPVLAMIVQRDATIANFKPETFFELKTEYREALFTHHSGRSDKPQDLEVILKAIENQPLTIQNIEKKEKQIQPPLLFDLTGLQKSLNKSAGFSASRTLKAAQELYEKKLITYPRTDSAYLTDDLFPSCCSTIEKLSTIFDAALNTPLPLRRSRRYFNNSKVSDHHAIIPTGLIPKSLTGDLKKVYDAIVKRFIAIFYPPCVKEMQKVTATVLSEQFTTSGSTILSKGWQALYSFPKEKKEEQELPQFQEGESGPHSPRIHKGETKPPKPFTEATLLAAMETAGKEIEDDTLREAMKERGLGTPATRAATIETLQKRDYIIRNKKSLHATDKGMRLIALLQEQPVLISPELTGQWEQKLKEIEKGHYSGTDFMHAVREFAQKIVGRISDRSSSSPGLCPLCGAAVIKGTKGGYGCSAWKEGCSFRFHGEQYGVKLSEDHVAQLLSRGRLSRIRKLTLPSGEEVQGYITLSKSSGIIGIESKAEKERREAIGSCPSCGHPVLEQYKSYSCSHCDLVIWKTISGKKVSPKLAQLLLSGKKSMKLKGFRSKAGKRFSAALQLKSGKIELLF